MSMAEPIRVMLVDDHAVVRAGYRQLLGQTPHIEVVCEAGRGEEACRLYAEQRPDVVVMDLSLPGIGGLETVRRLMIRDPAARVLIFSMHDEPLYVRRALEAGARGYITKSCQPEVLVLAVKEVAEGEMFLDPALSERMSEAGAPLVLAPPGLEQLAPREFDVFLLLAKGATTREVADQLCLSHKTVGNYATVIKAKLGVNTSAEMARLAIEQGLIGR